MAVDVVNLCPQVGGCGVAHRGGDDVGQVLLEPVSRVLVLLGPAGVVAVEPVDGAVIGHADQQGAAFPPVHKRSDRLQRGALEWLERLA